MKAKKSHVMHACGHDIHMSTFIGAARALAKLKDQWHGTIMFIGQPAEETVGGARAMLKDGLYTSLPKPDFALGLHDDAEIATGQIGVTEGYATRMSIQLTSLCAASADTARIRTRQKIRLCLPRRLLTRWQTIASRENNPVDPIVVTVGVDSRRDETQHHFRRSENATHRSHLQKRSARSSPRRDRTHRERLRDDGRNSRGLDADRRSAEGSVHARDL